MLKARYLHFKKFVVCENEVGEKMSKNNKLRKFILLIFNIKYKHESSCGNFNFALFNTSFAYFSDPSIRDY